MEIIDIVREYTGILDTNYVYASVCSDHNDLVDEVEYFRDTDILQRCVDRTKYKRNVDIDKVFYDALQGILFLYRSDD